MTVRWLVASLHLVALALGGAAIFARARFIGRARKPSDLPPVFLADNLWAVAAILWLGTGLWRAFGGLEKGTAYYLGSPLFHAKLGLFIIVVLLEIRPALTLIKWRRAPNGDAPVDQRAALRIRDISNLQFFIVLAMVFLATAMARGLSS